MKTFFSSLLTAVTVVLVTAGLSFGQSAGVAMWPLQSSMADSVTSNVTADSEAVVGLSAAYEVPAAGTTLNVQKLKPDAATSDGTNGTGSWPVETTLNTGRYVQFAFTPEAGFSARVDSVSMLIGSKGLSGINATVFYSMHGSFADSTSLGSLDTLIENAVMDTSLALNTTVAAGDTLFVRVYPWTNVSNTSTSKYFYVGNVMVDGAAVTTPMATVNGNDMLWSFQADSLGDSLYTRDWGPGNTWAIVAKDTIDHMPTHHIYEFMNQNYNSGAILKVVLPAGKTLADYDMLNFKGYFAQGDVGSKTFFVQAFSSMPGNGFEYNGDTVNNIGSYYRATDVSTGWESMSIPISGSFSMKDTVYLAFGFNGAATGGTPAVPTVWYADSIQLVQQTTTASPVTMWGIAPPRNNYNWHLMVTAKGDSANFNGGKLGGGWEGIRGAFKHPMVGTTSPNGAVVVSGEVTFVGEAPDIGSGMRYGIYNNITPGTLNTSVADSAYWDGFAESSYGYTISPQSGTDNMPSSYGFGGAGAAQWVAMGGSWISSYGGAVGIGPVVVQEAPSRATMNPGTYQFAFSVHPQANGTKLFKYYLIQKNSSGKIIYWDAASFVDTTSQTRSDTLNAVCFGVSGGPNMTGMIFSNVVDSLGPDITIPEEPWSNYYVAYNQFGMYGQNAGGWHMIPDIDGNATIAGDTAIPNFQHAYVLGGLTAPTAGRNTKDSTLYVTGDLRFAGGGFNGNTFTFGLFNTNPGNDDSTTTVGYHWTGANDGNSGYLFIPPSGTYGSPIWQNATQEQGNIGAVVGEPWQSTNGKSSYALGAVRQSPKGAVATAGDYVFAISVAPADANGAQQVNVTLYKPDSSYVWSASVMDNHKPLAATMFNAVAFGLEGGNPTDSLIITNVQVELNKPVAVPSNVTAVNGGSSNLPKTFALDQNYPNPFNPSTVIQYALPKASHVALKVYDVLGREVATLVNGNQAAGTYKVNFNMDKFASGVYFVRLVAGSFVRTEKMMLLK